MPFAINNNPEMSEVSEAVNYLLANFGANLAADPNTGEITGPTGIVIAYLYQYIAVKYADSPDGTLNFSNSPTGRLYYGLRNSNELTESTSPADYIWYKVAGGGFGSTKFLFYRTSGGRQIDFVVATISPGDFYLQDTGTPIDLDVVTTVTAYNSALVSIYQWTTSSTPPARPTTTSTYYWASGIYSAPSGWTTVPTSTTTPGNYQWAITIPLVESVNVETSVLNWANTAYPLYPFTSNGATGAPGANGLSAITAYLVQSQSAASPAGSFPQTTSGSTLPSGWSASLGTVAVGQVAWYSFGQYNNSSITINGIAPNTTYWSVPSAASIFQDIRSDNWNGSTPPTYGTLATYGTVGYYIQRSTGNCYFNNGVFRGDINTVGDAYFAGDNTATITVPLGSTSYNVDYSSWGDGATNASSSSVLRVGHFGSSTATTSYANIGVYGYAPNTGKGYGVIGTGGWVGGAFFGTGNSSTAIYASAFSSTTLALDLALGKMKYNGVTIQPPPGVTGYYLNGDGSWSSTSSIMTSASTNSGSAVASSNVMNLLGSTSTGIAGAYVGTTGSGNTVTFDVRTTSPSDVRLKEEIADSDLGLSFVNQLRPVSYKLKADPKHQKGYGFIAQEVEQIIGNETSLVYFEPEWKVGEETGFNTIHYPSYIAILTKAVQELSAKVAELEKKCASLPS